MIRTQNAFLWIAALCALTGTILVLSFLDATENQAYLLDGMEVAALMSMAALTVNLALNLIERDEELYADAAAPAEESGDAAAASLRRDEIDKRLQIDEPRLCLEKKMFCTWWSFCGGDSGLGSVPSTPEFRSRSTSGPADPQAIPGEDSIPTVDRGNVTDCPFP